MNASKNPRSKTLAPKVAVVIPIYNVEKYLRECLDSVLAQSYENLSVVLVDDKSTDSSLSIAKEYVERDRRVSLVALEENLGLSMARNAGLDLLEGKIPCGGGASIYRQDEESVRGVEWVHFLDSDDWLDLDCIAQCVEVALAHSAQIVFHWRKIFDELGGKFEADVGLSAGWGLRDGGLYSGLEILKSAPNSSFSWAWLGMVKLGFLTSHGLRFERGIESEDALFGMQLFALSHRVAVLDRGLVYYRVRAGSISQFDLKKEDRHRTKSLDSFSTSQRDIAQAFGGNVYLVRHYSFCHACGVIALKMVEFVEARREELGSEMVACLRGLIEHRVKTAFYGCGFESDPRDCQGICAQLLDYRAQVSWVGHLAYGYPRIYRALKWLKSRFV